MDGVANAEDEGELRLGHADKIVTCRVSGLTGLGRCPAAVRAHCVPFVDPDSSTRFAYLHSFHHFGFICFRPRPGNGHDMALELVSGAN